MRPVWIVLVACGGGSGQPIDAMTSDAIAVDVAVDAPVVTLVQQAYVKASNTATTSYFGGEVRLSADGNTMAVGASGEQSAATGIDGNQADRSAPYAGAVYVFARTGGTWAQQAYLKASNTNTQDLFGSALALSADGNTLAVGANAESSKATGIGGNQADNSAMEAGAVYLFVRTGSTWTQQAYIKASNTNALDFFGATLSLSADGDTLAVGAGGEASAATGVGGNQLDNSAPAAGAVYVFTRTGTTWQQQAYLKASNTDRDDIFGVGDGRQGANVVLSPDGNTLAIGAPGEASATSSQTDNSAPGAGAVYVFTRVAGAWSQTAYLKASNPTAMDHFGDNIAMSADGARLAVAADYQASIAGAVYVFSQTGATWTQDAVFTGSNTEAKDQFGWHLAFFADGNTLAVGARAEATTSGAVYLFRNEASTWREVAHLKASNTRIGTEFSVPAISADGATLAVGGFGDSSAATGINGDQNDTSAPVSGAVYVFMVQ